MKVISVRKKPHGGSEQRDRCQKRQVPGEVAFDMLTFHITNTEEIIYFANLLRDKAMHNKTLKQIVVR